METKKAVGKMSLTARLYIGLVISLGTAAFGYGLLNWETPNLPRFLFFLALAIPASCLKVTLPGIRLGTMSVLFIFLLGGIVELNLPETMVIGAVCVAAQSLWHSRLGVRLVQVVFSIATIELAVLATDFTYSATVFFSTPVRLTLAVSVFFVVNTLPIAVVISLTEGKPVLQVWRSSYLWCFPYYLVGAAIAGVFDFSYRMLHWQAAILVLPVVYVVYRSYRLYLDQLQGERQRADEERKHAAEIAVLHAKTLEALASAMTANARLDAVFRASPLAFLTLDGEGTVTSWNATAEEIFGWSSEEVVGQSLPAAAGRSECIIECVAGQALKGAAISGLEMKQWRKDGSPFEAAVWTAALPDSEGVSGYLITVADVSVRKRLEEELRLSQKLEAVGRLAGGVAHDFNNLLTIINGYSSMLIETVAGDREAAGQATEILGAGTRAAELVSQLLTFSRRRIIKPTPLELNQVVRDVERMLKRVIGEHIELRTNLHPDAGWIDADFNQMEGVLLNLSTNARDAMDGGGVLTIETSRVDVGADRPHPNTDLAPGSYVCLVVRDTGHGMDHETKQFLFEPFYTTKEQGKGTGLGLSSVYGGVEQNRGRIFVWSELGKGSALSIYLPRIEAPDKPRPAVVAPSRTMPVGTETILLVEDEGMVRRMIRQTLVRAGYRVLEAEHGQDAILRWAGEIEGIDLVLTDVIMPVMNGIRLMEELRKMRPGIRVICMSGHSEEFVSRHGGPEAPLYLLQKPFTPEVLVSKVREILDQPPKTDSEPRAPASGSAA